MGLSHHKAPAPVPFGQDDEEKGVSKGRTASCKFGGCPSVPLRARTQSTNMRVTAKQRG